MDNTVLGSLILGFIRDGLKAAGGGLVTQGLITSSDENIVIGAILTIVPVIFSAVANWRKVHNQAIVTAVQAHPRIEITPASATFSGKPEVSIKPELPPRSLGGMPT